MNLTVNPSSSQPIYLQLIQQIRTAIAQGQLQPQQQLPSVRELSKLLVINPNTVARVYTELEREGVLTTQQGRGVFIAQPRSEFTRAVREEKLQAALETWLTLAVFLGFGPAETLAFVEKNLKHYQWDLVKGPS